MTSTNDQSPINGHAVSRRVLLYLAVRGFSPTASLSLAQLVLDQNPKDLAEAVTLMRDLLPPTADPNWPLSFPPLNRRSMITDKLANGDFFNDLEL
ncbi:MAG: hypothetical protein LBS60_11130 [Deltaproteobacteria bacterium]|jgi:hypothetical protein|nr:hypothetical protein [Deltaproteobacteria bacterium]